METLTRTRSRVNPLESTTLAGRRGTLAQRRRLRVEASDEIAIALSQLRSALSAFKQDRSTPTQARFLTTSVEPALDCLTRALHRSDVIRSVEVQR